MNNNLMPTDLYVPSGKPQMFEKQFVNNHPALNMQLSAGSGSVWGDGDARPQVINYDDMQFGMEAKVRDESPNHLRPVPAEWKKAMTQLRKRNSGAIRLFAVYHRTHRTYAVTIPEEDVLDVAWFTDVSAEHLLNDLAEGTMTTEQGHTYEYSEWKKLYSIISDYVKGK